MKDCVEMMQQEEEERGIKPAKELKHQESIIQKILKKSKENLQCVKCA